MISIDICLPRKNFDLKIKQEFSSAITGIYGPSGSGKTSLFHALSGLATPKSGKVYINYRSVFDAERKINVPVAERKIGYVFQEGRLFPHLTVEKNLMYGYKKGEDNLIGYQEVVTLLNLGHILKSKPSSISGGERQRTALGRALLSSPEVLFLDEPFSAVDAKLRDQILPFIYKIQRRVKIPILVVSHDITDLLKLTHRLFIIKDGECLGHGNYTNLLRNPKLRDIIGTNVLVNALDTVIDKVEDETGILDLKHIRVPVMFKAVCDKPIFNCRPGTVAKAFVRSDDIAISSDYVDGISVHNQIKGEVIEIINGSNINVCVVDIGIPLLVEMTAKSAKQMELAPGKEVWCLFKSVAVDLLL